MLFCPFQRFCLLLGVSVSAVGPPHTLHESMSSWEKGDSHQHAQEKCSGDTSVYFATGTWRDSRKACRQCDWAAALGDLVPEGAAGGWALGYLWSPCVTLAVALSACGYWTLPGS